VRDGSVVTPVPFGERPAAVPSGTGAKAGQKKP